MATSGSSALVAVTAYDNLQFTWSVTEQDIANNLTKVACSLNLIASNYGAINSTSSKNYSVTVNGTTYSGTNTVGIANNATKVLWSATVSIPHDADGKKTFSYSFSQSFSGINFGGKSLGTYSGSGSGTLDTIPRASTITVPTFTLGSAGTITIARAVSSFTHTLTWSFGSQSGTIATKSTSTSVSWTPALTMATAIPSATSGTGTITCQTYNGNTLIGTTSKTFTANVPATVVPTCKVTVEDGTGNATKYGGYIQGISTAKVTVTGTPAQGSAIASYKTAANGSTYTTSSFTTGVLKTTGTNTITASVTDKRGRTGSANTSITVLAYTAPKITGLEVRRCDANGTANDQGEYCQVVFSGEVTSLSSKNTATWTLQYRRSGTAAWSSVTGMPTTLTASNVSKVFAASSGYSFEIQLAVKDAFKTTTKSTSISTGSTPMHWRVSGNGMGIGKVAEIDGGLDLGYDLRVRKTATFDGAVSFGQPNTVLSALGIEPVTITPTAGSNVTISQNSSFRIGRLVHIAVRLSTKAATAQYEVLLSGVPWIAGDFVYGAVWIDRTTPTDLKFYPFSHYSTGLACNVAIAANHTIDFSYTYMASA